MLKRSSGFWVLSKSFPYIHLPRLSRSGHSLLPWAAAWRGPSSKVRPSFLKLTLAESSPAGQLFDWALLSELPCKSGTTSEKESLFKGNTIKGKLRMKSKIRPWQLALCRLPLEPARAGGPIPLPLLFPKCQVLAAILLHSWGTLEK